MVVKTNGYWVGKNINDGNTLPISGSFFKELKQSRRIGRPRGKAQEISTRSVKGSAGKKTVFVKSLGVLTSGLWVGCI